MLGPCGNIAVSLVRGVHEKMHLTGCAGRIGKRTSKGGTVHPEVDRSPVRDR